MGNLGQGVPVNMVGWWRRRGIHVWHGCIGMACTTTEAKPSSRFWASGNLGEKAVSHPSKRATDLQRFVLVLGLFDSREVSGSMPVTVGEIREGFPFLLLSVPYLLAYSTQDGYTIQLASKSYC